MTPQNEPVKKRQWYICKSNIRKKIFNTIWAMRSEHLAKKITRIDKDVYDKIDRNVEDIIIRGVQNMGTTGKTFKL